MLAEWTVSLGRLHGIGEQSWLLGRMAAIANAADAAGRCRADPRPFRLSHRPLHSRYSVASARMIEDYEVVSAKQANDIFLMARL